MADGEGSESAGRSRNFIEQIIQADLAAGKNDGRVLTRFPPEPNGYLHIGHAKAICITYGLADEFGGKYNLRFDDTNPTRENEDYVRAIKEDIKWLGFDWEDRLFFASDYFERLHEMALVLIRAGKAYVCDLSGDDIRKTRGTLTEPGSNSPFRNRSIAENLELFARMRAGEYPDGTRTLRAKIDMASPNLNMRDPVMVRILRAHHHRTGDAWCIYPTYDWAHGQSDAIEGITHSLCSLEFENHRPLYDWFLDQLGVPGVVLEGGALPVRPRQIEFARLVMTYTVLSKRKLLQLVNEKLVSGWDDPRMPTLSGLRRRGFTASSIRSFCEGIGVAKMNSTIDVVLMTNSIRDELDPIAPRALAVLRPLKVTITNYPEGQSEDLPAANHPKDAGLGTRTVPFSRTIYIEREDFMKEPPPKFHRLAPGREVRLRYAYFIRCEIVIEDPKTGEVVELHCTYDPSTRGGDAPDGRKVKGTIHWVSAAHAREATVRLYDHLFATPELDESEGASWRDQLNPKSLEELKGCKLEPSLASAAAGTRFQFERHGYFIADSIDSRPGAPVFNRIVPLKDQWSKS